MKNRAALMQDIRKIEIQEIDMPECESDNIIVKMEYVGICGSDVHFYENGRIGNYIVEPPFILGHECAGTVVKVGNNVKNLVPGDRVALEPGVTCMECSYCKSGYYNLCPDVVFMATPPYDGALRNYVSYPENMAFKLPDNVSTLEGALVEPLAVGLHAARQANIRLGSKVIILGAGCIGLVTLLACKAMGATEIIVTDVVDKRLEFAKKLGADKVYNAKQENTIEKILETTVNKGFDAVIETAGSDVTIKQTAYLVRAGGTIVLVGLAQKDIIDFNFMQIMGKEAQIKSVFRYRNLYPVAIEAISKGFININDIVTHTFDFSQTKEGFDYTIENKEDVVKSVIKM